MLVTGGSGALGRLVARELRERGWRVRALAHRRPVAEASEVVWGDLADLTSLDAAADGADSILHLAAVTHARRARVYERVNAEGTRNLLRAASHSSVRRFVHVSTRAIDPSGGAYSRAKGHAETAVRESGLEFVIVRLAEVYGVGGEDGVDAILSRARRGRTIPIVDDGSDEVCPVFVGDVIEPLVASLSSPAAAGKTYTLAGECQTVRAFAEACVSRFGGGSRIVAVPSSAVAALSKLAHAVPLPLYPDQLARLRAPKGGATPEAAEDLGFRPRPLQEALDAESPALASNQQQ